jgi:hypothetical protein
LRKLLSCGISVKSLTAVLDGNNPAVGQGASEGSWTISNVQIVQTLRSVQSVAFGRIKPHATSAASKYPLFPDTDAVFFFTLRAERGHAVGEFVAFGADVGELQFFFNASANRRV